MVFLKYPELVAYVSCNFLTFLRCCVEDKYVAETFLINATYDSNLCVVNWGYLGEYAWDQDVLRHLDELPCRCRILD